MVNGLVPKRTKDSGCNTNTLVLFPGLSLMDLSSPNFHCELAESRIVINGLGLDMLCVCTSREKFIRHHTDSLWCQRHNCIVCFTSSQANCTCLRFKSFNTGWVLRR